MFVVGTYKDCVFVVSRASHIKGLVKQPMQFGDAVFVVLRISKLHTNL